MSDEKPDVGEHGVVSLATVAGSEGLPQPPLTQYGDRHARHPLAALTLGAFVACPHRPVGKVGVDWVGNDIIIEAIADPEVQGVTCHIAYFDRAAVRPAVQGQLVRGSRRTPPSPAARPGRSPSATSTAAKTARTCSSTSRSIILKSLRVKRIYDENNQTLIYVAHAPN